MSSTPALRGFPGGPGLPETGQDGESPAAQGASGRASSPWQRAQHAWQTAGADWVREPGWLPAPAWSDAARRHRVAGPQQAKPVGADWDHTEPIPAIKAAGYGGLLRGAGHGKPRPGGERGRRSRFAAPGIAGPLIAGVAVTALAVSVATVVLTRQPAPPARPAGLLPGYPAARLADATFAAGTAAAAPGVLPALTAVAADGSTVVAAGSQAGPPSRRAVLLVSADGGGSWRLASLQAPGGDVTGGGVPVLLAGGPGGWLALACQPGGAQCGQDNWTSATGAVWHEQPGIGLRPGDRVLGLARTGTGFLAVGVHVPPAGPARPRGVLWSSPNGVTWRRSAAPRLGLRPGNAVTALEQVAARGDTIVITGAAAPAGATIRGRRTALPAPARAWRSANAGATWAPVRLPAGHGATGLISGVAPDRSGFVLIRPGRGAGGRPDAVAYRSADGLSWQLAAVLAGARHTGLRVTGVSGNTSGAVLAATETARGGQAAEVALRTGTGRSWQRVLLLGRAAGGRIAAAAAGPGGSVLAAGTVMTARAAAGAAAAPRRQPVLLLAGPRYAFTGQQALARAATAGVAVTAMATAAGRQVAVGSANGGPAIWTAPAGGRWSADPPGTWATPGLSLTSVTHGDGGWLAVGQLIIRRQAQLVLLASRDAVTWQAVTGLRRLAAPGTQLTQAAAGRDGYVLVGQDTVAGRPAAVAWWSATSGAWSQASVTPPPGRPGAHPVRQPSQMLAVAAGGPGFVAAGALGSHPVTWSSADGRSWAATVLPVPAGARSAVLARIAARGPRVAAIGTELTAAGQLPFAAVSRDAGRTWREFRLPMPACRAGAGAVAAASQGGATVSAITAAASGFVATGGCGGPGRLDVVVWSSADGRTWTAASPPVPGLSGPGAQQITALTAAGTAVTGAGYTATLAGSHPTLWRLRAR